MPLLRRALWPLAFAACAAPQGLPSERLLETLGSAAEAERPLLVAALGARGGRPAALALAARLGAGAPVVAEALGRTGAPEAVGPLLALWEGLLERKFKTFTLSAEDEALLAVTARALGRLGDIKAVPALRRGLLDDAGGVAAAAAEALARLGDAGSVETLARLSGGASAETAQAALEALGGLGGPAAEAALRAGLESPEAARRVAAAYGLARRDQIVGRLTLEGFLEESAEPTAEGVAAAGCLARLGRAEGAAFLARVPGALRPAAIAALGSAGTREAARALGPAAADPEADVRRRAAEALSDLPGPEAMSLLKRLKADGDAGVRAAARLGLARHGFYE